MQRQERKCDDHGEYRKKWKLKRWLKGGENGSAGENRGEEQEGQLSLSASCIVLCSHWLMVVVPVKLID